MAGPPFIKLPLPRPGGDGVAGQPSGAAGPLDCIPLFALVSPELRARIRKKLAWRSVPDGKPLFRAGEPSDALYVVQSGRFRIFVRDRFNREHVLRFVGPGEVLGEAALLADAPHVVHAEAVEPARVWRLARGDFEALLGNEQAVLRYLAGVISQRQAQANARVVAESTPEEARAERGYVTAIYSPRGGAGGTTLAVALGVALAERHPDDVVVLDLDVLFGHTASYLWLQPKGVLAQVPPNTLHQLDRRGLDYYLLPHESSLRVFPAALRPEEGEQVSADHVRAAVSTLKRHFGHVLLDLPHGFSEVALTGLEMANRVLVLATPELTTLRDIVEVRRIFAELLGLPAAKARYVLNHPHPYGGIPVADFAAATGAAWEEIAFGGDGPSQAALRGEALLNTRPGNPVSKAATRLAETVGREARELLALAGR
jgi:CRP-like cAMP-binding protein